MTMVRERKHKIGGFAAYSVARGFPEDRFAALSEQPAMQEARQ